MGSNNNRYVVYLDHSKWGFEVWVDSVLVSCNYGYETANEAFNDAWEDYTKHQNKTT